MDLEFPTIAAGDMLMHLRFAPGFETEEFTLGDTGLSLLVTQDDEDVVHVLVLK